jgi:hypothetical protein
VQAVTDGTRIAFRLEWADATRDELPGSGRFADGCAVQLPVKAEADVPAPQMGEAGRPVEISYWRSSWQGMADGRKDDIKALYPGASVDHYPFEAASLKPGSPEQLEMEARYAPARALGNTMEGPREGTVQDLIAEGPGTIRPAPEQRAAGRGLRTAAAGRSSSRSRSMAWARAAVGSRSRSGEGRQEVGAADASPDPLGRRRVAPDAAMAPATPPGVLGLPWAAAAGAREEISRWRRSAARPPRSRGSSPPWRRRLPGPIRPGGAMSPREKLAYRPAAGSWARSIAPAPTFSGLRLPAARRDRSTMLAVRPARNHLCLKEAFALSAGEPEAAAVAHGALGEFLRSHLGVFAGPLARRLWAGGESWLAAATCLLVSRAGDAPDPGPPIEEGQAHPEAPCALDRPAARPVAN